MFVASPPMSFATIPQPAFGRAAQHLPTNTPAKVRSEIKAKHAAKIASELLPELPEAGESIFALMTGHFDLCSVLIATANRLPTLRHLRIATLCFSKRNTVELLGILESRPTLRLTLLVSAFFKGHNAELYERFAEDLKEHPMARLATGRTHVKCALFDIADDDGLVLHGSANLRTNKNVEQLCAQRDRPLHDWFAEWLDGQVRLHDAEEETN